MPDAKALLRASLTYAREDRGASAWHLWSTLSLYGLLVAATCLELFLPLRVAASLASGLVLVRSGPLRTTCTTGTI